MAKRGWKMRAESEWAEIVKRYEAGGLSQFEFCEREGIAKSTFSRWYHKLGIGKGAGKLVELGVPAGDKSAVAVEVEFPTGLVLRIRG